jgi:hypothetical protein
MKSPLDQLEAKFKNLFEGRSVLAPWVNDRSDSVTTLLDGINTYLQTLLVEKDDLPDQFAIYLNRSDAFYFESQPELRATTSELIVELASQYGCSFPQRPKVKFITRNSLSAGELEIKPIRAKQRSDQTDAFRVQPEVMVQQEQVDSLRATLLFGDKTIFTLSNPVTNLGRKSNNHIVFDDLRVSRNHAQIRYVFTEYILFDTGSSGGTYVNGERIIQCKLKPGDVISLAGLKLIFSEDNLTNSEAEREITSKLNPVKKEA